MEGFRVDADRVDAAAIKSPENGGSWPNQQLDLHHRRSKSASERPPDYSRQGASVCVRSNRREILMSPLSSKAYGARTRLHDYPTSVRKTSSTNQQASLEKDVNNIEELQLRLQQEKSMRMMLEKAMGRASSTLSPGHRHFAVRSQMKELIKEIELLEEEVTNREQHVLSLYRNIFEQCVSRAPSEQNSVVASPAHTKQVPRRHPSIISSAFCSSKTFPLRSLRSLVTLNNMGKGIYRTPDAQFSIRESDISFEKTSPDQVKALEKAPASEKTSVLRTLKDHLYQCPVKLSEDMVRCMAAVYFWLRNASSGAPGKNRSPILSRSSTNLIPPHHSIREDREWSSKSMVEISWISNEKSRFSRASYAINSYRVLVEHLERVTLSQVEKDSRIAFWINVYNAMVMHAYLAYGVPHSSLKRLALFHRAAYNIGGYIISANVIEHSILCFHTPRVGKWFETFLSTALRKKSSVEDKQLIAPKFGLSSPQPLVCFALCTGAVSDPVLKVYTASNVKDELDQAKTEFLQSNVMIKKFRTVFLPKILERFGKEASISSNNLLNWVSENVDKKLSESIQKCIHRKSNKKASQLVEWLPYNSRFRYVFSKDLMEKPWMV